MDKTYVAKDDALVPERNKSVSGTFTDARVVSDFNPAYETIQFRNSVPDITAPCNICYSPVVVDRMDRGTFHICEDCRRAILFLKYNWHELEELIHKSHR